MVSFVKSIGLNGLDGYIVNVESTLLPGLTGCEIVGLPDTSVREAKERVLSAIKNIGFSLPYGKSILNLSPANQKKVGAMFDLAIAISLLITMENIPLDSVKDYAFLGELSLDGKINSISGILPMTICAQKNNIKTLIIPKDNAKEASVVKGIKILLAENLMDVVCHLAQKENLEEAKNENIGSITSLQNYVEDFSDVKGQKIAKRALEIAAAGNHNILLIGSPGAGKTMLARRIPSILPNLTFEESLEITKIYSISGLLPKGTSLITTRPFRSPHHTISSISLVGGGSVPKPGEISLSHNGVLFLDELPEFHKNTSEVMRQPLEDREITVCRINGTFTYPSNFMFVASMNPCPCGYYGSTSRQCTCTPKQIHNYISKISGPLLDRIDIQLEVPTVQYSDLHAKENTETSEEIRKRVNLAREIQLERYKIDNIFSNSELSSRKMKEVCVLDSECDQMLKNAFEKLNLSARAYSRVLKVARTIADLEGSENIKKVHIAEAIQYRSLDRKYFNNNL